MARNEQDITIGFNHFLRLFFELLVCQSTSFRNYCNILLSIACLFIEGFAKPSDSVSFYSNSIIFG